MSTMPCKNYFTSANGKVSQNCDWGAKCKFSHKNEDCAKFPCPMMVPSKTNPNGVCLNKNKCPYSHNVEVRKTFQYEGCEVKSAGILMFRRTKEGIEYLLVEEKEKGYFSDPGGKLNVDDATIFEGAKREFREETGCIFNQKVGGVNYIPTAKYLLFLCEVADNYQLSPEKDKTVNPKCKFITFGIFRAMYRPEELPPINPRLCGCLPGFPTREGKEYI